MYTKLIECDKEITRKETILKKVNEWKHPEDGILISTAVCIMAEIVSYFIGMPAWAPVVIGLITIGHFYRQYNREHPVSQPGEQALPAL